MKRDIAQEALDLADGKTVKNVSTNLGIGFRRVSRTWLREVSAKIRKLEADNKELHEEVRSLLRAVDEIERTKDEASGLTEHDLFGDM